MFFNVITLFPQIFDTVKNHGVTGQAIKKNIIQIKCWNPRDFTKNRHKTVDDRPYGGGPGMLMKVQPLNDTINAAKKSITQKDITCQPKVIYLSPQGKRLDQKGIEQLANQKALILIAGRYEGIDERLIEDAVDEEISIGDYVLSGGELPAMVLIDAIARLTSGTLGDCRSAKEDSFSNGLLDHPQYTRPQEYLGKRVPEVLFSGHHTNIAKWRLKQSLGKTWLKRPDLIKSRDITDTEKELLKEFISEYKSTSNQNLL